MVKRFSYICALTFACTIFLPVAATTPLKDQFIELVQGDDTNALRDFFRTPAPSGSVIVTARILIESDHGRSSFANLFANLFDGHADNVVKLRSVDEIKRYFQDHLAYEKEDNRYAIAVLAHLVWSRLNRQGNGYELVDHAFVRELLEVVQLPVEQRRSTTQAQQTESYAHVYAGCGGLLCVTVGGYCVYQWWVKNKKKKKKQHCASILD